MPTTMTLSSYNYNSKNKCHSFIYKKCLNCFYILIYTDFMLIDLEI